MVPLNILFANLNKLKWSFYLTIILASSFNILKSLKSAKRFGKLIFRKLLNIYQFNAAWCYTSILTLMMIVITTWWWSSTILNLKNTMILLNFVQRGNLRCFCCCHSCRHLASSQYLMTVIIWCRSSSISYDYFIEVIECFAFFHTVCQRYTDYARFTLTLSFQHNVCIMT